MFCYYLYKCLCGDYEFIYVKIYEDIYFNLYLDWSI